MGSIKHYYFNDYLKSPDCEVLGFKVQEILGSTHWSLMELLSKELNKNEVSGWNSVFVSEKKIRFLGNCHK